MDSKTVVQWVTAAVARGVAWFLAGKLGFEAVQADDLGTAIAGAVAALVVAGVAIYTSIKGRKKLTAAQPPRG